MSLGDTGSFWSGTNELSTECYETDYLRYVLPAQPRAELTMLLHSRVQTIGIPDVDRHNPPIRQNLLVKSLLSSRTSHPRPPRVQKSTKLPSRPPTGTASNSRTPRCEGSPGQAKLARRTVGNGLPKTKEYAGHGLQFPTQMLSCVFNSASILSLSAEVRLSHTYVAQTPSIPVIRISDNYLGPKQSR